MPKVWPVFGLFEDDRVLDIPEDGEEPVKIVSLKDYFIVATTTGKVLVYKLGSSKCKLVHKFNTVDSTIYDIQYMESTDYIVTLEKEDAKSRIRVVRVYKHWRTVDSLKATQPATYSPPSSSYSYSPSSSPNFHIPGLDDNPLGEGEGCGEDSDEGEFRDVPQWAASEMEVTKLPFHSSIRTLGVCRQGKMIGVTTATHLTLWMVHKTKPLERLLTIQQADITEISIFFDYVAFCTPTEVFVVRVRFQQKVLEEEELPETAHVIFEEQDGKKKASTLEVASTSEKFNVSIPVAASTFQQKGSTAFKVKDESYKTTIAPFTCDGRSKVAVPMFNLNVPSVGNPNKVPPPSETQAQLLGKRPDVHAIEFNTDSDFELTSAVMSLVYRRFLPDSGVHSLIFVPEFQQYGVNSTELTASIKLNALRFFVSTNNKGYLFNLYGNTSVITTYDYSQEATHATIENGLLYILTEEGV